jgi:hypothetical protein
MTTRNTSNPTQEFKGLAWDEPLKKDRIKYIEDTFGPVKETPIELANLIRKTNFELMKAGPDGKVATCWIEIGKKTFLKVSPNLFGPAVCILASVKRLQSRIEEIAGGELQAERFYEDTLRALIGLALNDSETPMSALDFRGSNDTEIAAWTLFPPTWAETRIDRNQVENVAKTLERWQKQVEHLHRSTKALDSAHRAGQAKAHKVRERNKEIRKEYQEELPKHPKKMAAVGAVATKRKISPRQVQRIISNRHR